LGFRVFVYCHFFIPLNLKIECAFLPFFLVSIRSERWFKETQVSLLQSPSSLKFPEWFHGILSRHEAEGLLAKGSWGTFLVRACDNRFGYALSLKRRDGSCVHHMIVQLEATCKYVVVGESKVHASLASLLRYYARVIAE